MRYFLIFEVGYKSLQDYRNENTDFIEKCAFFVITKFPRCFLIFFTKCRVADTLFICFQCSQPCGGGTKTRSAKCVDENNIPIDDAHCRNSKKIVKESCNDIECPYWIVNTTSAVSSSAECSLFTLSILSILPILKTFLFFFNLWTVFSTVWWRLPKHYVFLRRSWSHRRRYGLRWKNKTSKFQELQWTCLWPMGSQRQFPSLLSHMWRRRGDKKVS